MKKTKRWLAVLMAAVMMLTPAAEVYAANATMTVSENEPVVVVTETEEATETVEEVKETEASTEEISGETVEETTEEVAEETEEAVESTEETVEETVTEETTEEAVTEEVTTEEATTEEATTEEVTTEEETTEEATTEEVTTEEETTEEATTEEETTEEATTEEETTEEVDEHNWNGSGHKAPELEMNLSSAMVAEKKELQGTVERLTSLQEGVQYVANQAVFMADSQTYASEVAEGYGAELDSYESGVATMSFKEDVTEIIAMAEDMDVMLPAVYPNYIYTTYDDVIVEYASASQNDIMAISNDEGIGYQTYHSDIKTSAAWAYNNTAGKGIKVAVIDSGIDKNHYDLKGKSTATVTYATPYNKAADNNGHGTHVSGIIAAKKDNGAYGAGVAYNASILSIKALENNPITGAGSGDTAAIIKAVNKATSSGARVINMSLGGPYYDALFEAAVNKAVNKGIVVVAAAGNDSKTLSTSTSSATYYSPACFANVITVSAATTGSAGLASFSNRGNGIIDIAAPGTDIASTMPGDLYAYMSGTSQAAPQVAAAAAYILSANPTLAKSKTKATVDTVTQILKDSATKGSYNNATYYGAGLLNVEAAVKMAAPSDTNNTALQAPKVMVGGAEVKAGQTIQDTDTITLTSALGATANSNIKIYYTTNGKAPKETADNLYTGSFKLAASGTKTIKAMAVYYGTKSKVTTTKVKVNAYVTNFAIASKTEVFSVASGKSLQLSATNITPSYATNKAVTWAITSGSEYATISKGKVTAKKGITEKQTVTVSAAMQKAGGTIVKTATITILPVATKLELTNKADAAIKLTYPSKVKMNLTVTPATVTPPIKYTSSNAKVATVDSSGTITAVGSGKATITAKTMDGSNKTAKMTVTVIKPVQSVTVKSKTGVLAVAAGKSLAFVADVTADASNKAVEWSVAPKKSGVSIDGISIKNGTLTTKTSVKSLTEVVVTATAKDGSGRSGSVTVTVYPYTTTKVALEPFANGSTTTYTLGTRAIGDLKTSVQLYPYTNQYTNGYLGRQSGSGTANLGNFTYKSSNTKVATVSSTGVVSVVGAAGSAKITITAKDGSKKSTTCTIKVVKPVTTMSLYSKNGLTYVARKKTLQLGASINSDATNKKLSWTSSNPAVATVDSKGKVKGVSYGSSTATATIMARTTDGSNISKTFTVTVKPLVTKLAYYTWFGWKTSNVYTTLGVGTYESIGNFAPYMFDETDSKNPTERADYWDVVAYSYSNSEVIQVVPDANGYVSVVGLKKGKAKLTFKAMDGSGKKVSIEVRVQ